MNAEIKKILNDIKCGTLTGLTFTQADLDKVKACLPEPPNIPSTEEAITSPTDDECVNSGIEKIQKIIHDQTSKQGLVIEITNVRAKVQEAVDHYEIISTYYEQRVKFFTDTLTSIEPFTAQYLYWDSEVDRYKKLEKQAELDFLKDLLTYNPILALAKETAFLAVKAISDNSFTQILPDLSNLGKFVKAIDVSLIDTNQYFKQYVEYRLARITAEANAVIAKRGGSSLLSAKIQDLHPLPGNPNDARLELYTLCSEISGQLIPGFINQNVTTAFNVRLIGLDNLKIGVPELGPDGTTTQVEKTINIRTSQYLSNSPFVGTVGTNCIDVSNNDQGSIYSKYETIPGALYNKVSTGYEGLYRKLNDPINYLFTFDERGLTDNQLKVDPTFKNVSDAPISIKAGDQTLYIKDQTIYDKFYETLEKTMPTRVNTERTVKYPAAIKSSLSKLKNFALREVADQFRDIEDFSIKLARPTSYKAGSSNIYSQGSFEYSSVDKVLSDKLSYYQKSYDQILNLIKIGKAQLVELDKRIKENSLDEKEISKKISEIPCFKNLKTADCTADELSKLGKDPLMIRTLDEIDPKLPGIQTKCYWDQFAKALNKISILPIPDKTGTSFRYYPINNIIPTPTGLVLVPLPQKWKTLFFISGKFGTVVSFLVMPIAIVGIPLPSVYVMYIAPDGKKYMLLAPNLPVLYNPIPKFPIVYGFEPDSGPDTNNQSGLSGPYKGSLLKGSLTTPLSTAATVAKAARLLDLAAKAALGEDVKIENDNGVQLDIMEPALYALTYLSSFEVLQEAVDDNGDDFNKQVKKFRRDLNNQFNNLGKMQLEKVTQLKESIRVKRNDDTQSAEQAETAAKRREARKKAQSIDPTSLTDKISSIVGDLEKYVDKINLGTIYYPSDPRRLNPKPGAAVNILTSLNELTSSGVDENTLKVISLIKTSIVPALAILELPQSLNPVGLPFPTQIKIPLDALVKPVLKETLSLLIEVLIKVLAEVPSLLAKSGILGKDSSLSKILKDIPCGINNKVAKLSTTSLSDIISIKLPNGINLNLNKLPEIPLNIVEYFYLLTSSDLVELIRGMALAVVDDILIPISEIVTGISKITTNLKGVSFNQVESSNPYIAPIKIAEMIIQLALPSSAVFKIINSDAIDQIKAVYLPVVTKAEPALKEIAYLGAVLSCSLGPVGVKTARIAANPFMNQDDLPPWERLTHKNPLFAIFLDEIAWRSTSISTGTLLFKSKTPTFYPVNWTPTIFNDPGAH